MISPVPITFPLPRAPWLSRGTVSHKVSLDAGEIKTVKLTVQLKDLTVGKPGKVHGR